MIFGPITLQLGLHRALGCPTQPHQTKKRLESVSANAGLYGGTVHCTVPSSLQDFWPWTVVVVNVVYLSNDVVLSILRHLQELNKPNWLNG